VDDSVTLAVQARAKKLFLFHHDPDHSDQMMDRFVQHARQLAARQKARVKVEAAREGAVIRLHAK
jgi:hypothetical protein